MKCTRGLLKNPGRIKVTAPFRGRSSGARRRGFASVFRLPRGAQVDTRPPRAAKRVKGGGESLEVHRCRGEEGLDTHVLQSAPHGARQSVPGLRFAVEALRAPAVALIEALILGRPALASTAGPQKRRMLVADHDRLVETSLRQAQRRHRTTRAVSRAGVEEAAMRNAPARSQHLAARASGDVVPGVVAEAAQRNRALDRLGLGRDERINTASLEPAIDREPPRASVPQPA